MPSLFGGASAHSPGLSMLSAASRSRANSRPASPTASAFTTDDPLNDYFSGANGNGSVPVPAAGRPALAHAGSSAFSYVSDGVASVPHTPVGSYSASNYASSLHNGTAAHQPLEIVLDSDNLVLRGQGGDLNPAYLSGHLSLWLNESTNVKDITMTLTGKAKVHYTEASTHNYTHPIVHHEWSFLEATAGKKGKAHTLKAGHHSFPFSFTLDGNLPASFTTFTGDGDVSYKLRATVVRSGLAFNLSTARTFDLTRSFTHEALEFNQTLEIENTWPGKIMYSITIPFKAYAAGDDIPVLVKFMPLAKGVRVLSVNSVIKEYSLVQTRTSSHSDTRVAVGVKHEIRDGKAVQVEREVTRPPAHWHGISQLDWSRANSASNTQPPTPQSESAEPSNNNSSASLAGTDVNVGDNEVETNFTVPIPPWTTPSHSVKPVFVNHKIKWSCSISNADGHISELRCALPIIILGHSMLDEARTNSAATRALLVNGAVDENAAAQIDLPSYSNHVYDRLAVTDSTAGSSGFSSVAGWRSVNATPHHSPSHTPPTSRPPSRPASPAHGSSRNSVHEVVNDLPPRRQLELGTEASLLRSLGNLAGPSGEQEQPDSSGRSGHHSGAHSQPISGPHSGHSTPPDSFAMSREGSRSRTTSRAGSRAGSRASSPERGHGDRPSASRRSTGLGGLLHLPTGLKPLSALGGKSPILRNGTGSGGASAASSPILTPNSPGIIRNASFLSLGANGGVSTSNSRQSAVTIAPSAFQRPERPRRSSTVAAFSLGGADTPDDEEEAVGRLSRVPSYTDNSDAFVVPLDPSLPSYVDSEREIERVRSHIDLMRARSDTALVDLGAAAAAAAEERAEADAEGSERAEPAA
ncbi:hypothetical protein Q8F55_000121 [Vanrija albida]|uniref:Arrestin C-terminal-like domain-containing protein n=1 Tax=Vanrija albida TaxID=181172 RepID=A0ABR3QCC9_9TREE